MILTIEVPQERRTALLCSPPPSALASLRKLREAGILVMLREASGSRPAVLAFAELLNPAEGRKVL